MRYTKAVVYILCIILLLSCSTTLKVIDSEKSTIVAGREGVKSKDRYTLTVKNRCKKDVTIKEIIVCRNNRYYNMAFDITIEGKTTLLKRLKQFRTYTIIAIPKYETALPDSYCTKNFKVLIKYTTGTRNGTLYVKNIKEGKVILQH